MTKTSPSLIWYWGACGSLIVLMLMLTAWELFLAPLRPGGSWLVLKVLPLCFALPGILKRRLYTYQWSVLLIWLYVCEGIVRGMSDPGALSRALGWLETALALVFAVCVLAYVRPYKQAWLAEKPARAAAIDAQYKD